MIRLFCDECGSELVVDNPDVVNPRWRRRVGQWSFALIQTYKGISNTGNLCKGCLGQLLIEAVDNGEEPTKANAVDDPMAKSIRKQIEPDSL